jgi:hypothetical protein
MGKGAIQIAVEESMDEEKRLLELDRRSSAENAAVGVAVACKIVLLMPPFRILSGERCGYAEEGQVRRRRGRGVA